MIKAHCLLCLFPSKVFSLGFQTEDRKVPPAGGSQNPPVGPCLHVRLLIRLDITLPSRGSPLVDQVWGEPGRKNHVKLLGFRIRFVTAASVSDQSEPVAPSAVKLSAEVPHSEGPPLTPPSKAAVSHISFPCRLHLKR